MNRLLLFLKNIYVLLLFIVLEVAALNYYAGSDSYAKAKIMAASNSVSGYVHKGFSEVGDYFGLRRENDSLLGVVAALRNRLEDCRAVMDAMEPIDIPPQAGLYSYRTASVVNNSITRQDNYITIDRGERDSIGKNMALITPEGNIAGYVLQTSGRFAIGISVLNRNFRTGGKIRGRDFYGSVWWDGRDNTRVTLSEVPKYANIKAGDTIVTGYSSIFPPDVMIGRVVEFELTRSNSYEAQVELFDNMSSLKRVLVVNYAEKEERELLERDYR